MTGSQDKSVEEQPTAGVDTYVSADRGVRERVSAPLLAALEDAWTVIRCRHPEVPEVVLVVAAGSGGTSAGGMRLGHFAAQRWHRNDTTSSKDEGTALDPREEAPDSSGEATPEVFVGGEGLALGPVDVLGTLLHEAAHALAHVRGVRDTSRQGRYHNKRYAALARELGLEVAEHPELGWTDTQVPSPTQRAYTETLAALGEAIRWWRTADLPSGRGGRTSSNNPQACLCTCPRRIRVSASTLAQGPILCGVCGETFEPA